MKYINFLLIIIILFTISSCSPMPAEQNNLSPNVLPTNSEIYDNINPDDIIPISKIDYVYTSERLLSLTFNGLPSRNKLTSVLALLDDYNIKATFFIPGIRAAEEPNLVQLILDKGHTIQNNTLNKSDLSNLGYSDIYKEISLSKQIIETSIDSSVKYVRADKFHFDEPVLKAAAQSKHERYIGYSLYLTDAYIEETVNTSKDLRHFVRRGAIVAIDLDRNDNIERMLELLVPAVAEVKYSFVTLEQLIQAELPKQPYYEIEGFDLAQINKPTLAQPYHLFYKGNELKKQVALTIDDWGTDYTITNMLDILAEKGVEATFFIRANGAENNPSLARAIRDAGHEIANHTYSHPVITTISEEQIQEEVVKSHQVLTEAIQEAPAMYFRPPTGAFDEKSIRAVAATGYTDIAMYDITTLDWEKNTTADDIYRIITDNVTNGSIVLLHMLDDIKTLDALPRVIDFLQQEGYELVTVTTILK